MTKPGSVIRVREISEADIEAMVQLFGKGFGFPDKTVIRMFDALRAHNTPPEFPKYGWLLEVDSTIEGGIMLAYADVGLNECRAIRCHVAMWYVKPEFRSYSAIFTLRALGHQDVTYVNLSASPAARPIIEAQGFMKYSKGQFFTLPILNYSFSDAAQVVKTEMLSEKYKGSSECDLLLAHERFGCISIWCVTPESAHPFVFQPRSIKRLIPAVRLVYCRHISELVRFAGPLGLYLAARGRMVVSMEANEVIPGLRGRYFDGLHPHWYKGTEPRLGDLTYTIRAMLT